MQNTYFILVLPLVTIIFFFYQYLHIQDEKKGCGSEEGWEGRINEGGCLGQFEDKFVGNIGLVGGKNKDLKNLIKVQEGLNESTGGTIRLEFLA